MELTPDYSGIHERHHLLRQDLPLNHLKKSPLWERYFLLFGFFCWLEKVGKRLETSLGCWVHVRKRIPDDEHT